MEALGMPPRSQVPQSPAAARAAAKATCEVVADAFERARRATDPASKQAAIHEALRAGHAAEDVVQAFAPPPPPQQPAPPPPPQQQQPQVPQQQQPAPPPPQQQQQPQVPQQQQPAPPQPQVPQQQQPASPPQQQPAPPLFRSFFETSQR